MTGRRKVNLLSLSLKPNERHCECKVSILVLTVGDNTACTSRNTTKAMYEDYTAGSEGVVDKITDTG